MSFAEFQADWRGKGWRIEHAELRLDGLLQLSDGRQVALRGRIDRIDRHDSGDIAIIDYKTSEQLKSAQAKHMDGEEWLDLQLPLCRHLWEQSRGQPGAGTHVGFISLPQQAGGCKFTALELTSEQLSDAVSVAGQLVERIEALEFVPSDEAFGNRLDVLRGFGFLDLGTPVSEEGL